MIYSTMQQIFNGFVEAMFFADGADADFKDNDGFYMDGQFNENYELSNQAKINIKTLLETIVPKLPDAVYKLTLRRIGQCIYYEVAGHGTGFSDDLDLSEEDENIIYQLFFNSVFLEIYDNDESQEIEFSYSENWK